MSSKKVKPTYEFIRYDIRPSSGLSDVESDYLVSCVDKLQAHSAIKGVRFAFELPGTAYPKRSTGKHAHLGIWFNKGVRTDKVPVINMAEYAKSRGWHRHAIKVVTAEKFSVGEYWKCGYIEKDGQSIGNIRPMVHFWYDHERAIKSTVYRPVDMTCGSVLGDVVNWWYQNSQCIIDKHKELLAKPNALGVMQCVPVDIRHVYAHYVITNHPNIRTERRIARRLWLAQTDWSDYLDLVKMVTNGELEEVPDPDGYYSTKFDMVEKVYHPMSKKYPIE